MDKTNIENFDFDDLIEEVHSPSPKKIAKIEAKELIAKLVQPFPCLWNKADKFYKNQTKRNAAWDKIAEDTSKSGKHF